MYEERKNTKEGKNEGKIRTFIFLLNLTDSSFFVQNNTNNICNYVCVYVYISASVYLYISKMTNTNDTRAGRKKLGLFCYYKIHYL